MQYIQITDEDTLDEYELTDTAYAVSKAP